jgi:hypothetical protein
VRPLVAVHKEVVRVVIAARWGCCWAVIIAVHAAGGS